MKAAFLALLIPVAAARADLITYSDQIRPLFQTSCLNCHNPDKQKAGLDLSTYEAMMNGGDSGKAVEPGNSGKSLLFKLLTHAEEPAMPRGGDKLPDSQLDLIRKWIDSGAPDKTGGGAFAKKPGGGPALALVAPEERPKGPPPMPVNLSLEPVVRARRAGAIAGLAGSPWAPLAAVTGQKQVLLYNTDTMELAGVLPFPEGFPQTVRFSRDGRLLLAGGGVGAKLGRVVVWDVATGKRVIEAGDEFDAVLAADISPDHSLIALGGPNKLVKIFSARDGRLLHKMKKHTDWVTALAFTPDGKSLISGDRAGGLSVWDANGREMLSLSAHKGAVTAVACLSNLIATASEDGTIKLWDMAEGKERASWNAHKGGVLSIAFAPDGNIVSCGRDFAVRLWAPGGNRLREFDAFQDVAMQAAFAGGKVIAGDWTGTVRAWTPDGRRAGTLDANPPTMAERVDAAAKRVVEIESLPPTISAARKQAEEEAAKSAAELGAAAAALKAEQASPVSLETRDNLARLNLAFAVKQAQAKAANEALASARRDEVSYASRLEAARAVLVRLRAAAALTIVSKK